MKPILEPENILKASNIETIFNKVNISNIEVYNTDQDLDIFGPPSNPPRQLIYFTSEFYNENPNPGPYPVEIVDISYSTNRLSDTFSSGGLLIAYQGINNEEDTYNKYNYTYL